MITKKIKKEILTEAIKLLHEEKLNISCCDAIKRCIHIFIYQLNIGNANLFKYIEISFGIKQFKNEGELFFFDKNRALDVCNPDHDKLIFSKSNQKKRIEILKLLIILL